MTTTKKLRNREYDLRLWRRAIQVVVRHDLDRTGWLSDARLPVLYARVLAELAHLDGTMGLDDDAKAEQISELFSPLSVTHADAMPVWLDAADEAEANAQAMKAKADKILTETGVAALQHKPMVSGKELAAALNLTFERKNYLFNAPLVAIDGKVMRGEKIKTRLPTWTPTVPAKKDPGDSVPSRTWTLPLERRRYLRDRLGYRLDTISAKQRTLTEAEFMAWTETRERQTWPADRLEGRKEPGESDYHATRRLQGLEKRNRARKPGVTAARRAYAEAFGCGKTKAKEMTAGMSEDVILSLIGSENVTPATRYECHARPDKSDQNRPFLENQRRITSPNRTTENVTQEAMPNDLNDRDMLMLANWYLAKKGKPLKPATVRKWRERQTLDRMLFTASEFVVANRDEWPAVTCMHAEMRVRHYQERRRETEARKRYSGIGGNVVPLARWYA